MLEAEGIRAAVLGVDGAGLAPVEGAAYDPSADPRARAYLPDVDPPYFAAHMEHVLGTVLPWALQR